MSKLLIVDVQNSYMEWISQDDLLSRIEKLAENYSAICYLWDNISGQDLYDELPEDWINPEEEDSEPFYDKFNRIIEKQYGYIRSIMDAGHEKEDIVKLGKFMLNHKITDARQIIEEQKLFKAFKKEFKNSSLISEDFESNCFSLPTDLIEDLEGLSGCSLVGGARDQCLEEVSLLMKIADIDHIILEEYCY